MRASVAPRPGKLKVSGLCGADHGDLGQQVELSGSLAIPRAGLDGEDQARATRAGQVVRRRASALSVALHGRGQRQQCGGRKADLPGIGPTPVTEERAQSRERPEFEVARPGDEPLEPRRSARRPPCRRCLARGAHALFDFLRPSRASSAPRRASGLQAGAVTGKRDRPLPHVILAGGGGGGGGGGGPSPQCRRP